MNPSGSDNEVKCPVLAYFSPKKKGKTGTMAAQVFLLKLNYFCRYIAFISSILDFMQDGRK